MAQKIISPVFIKASTNKVVSARTCCASDCFGWMIAVHEIFWYKIEQNPTYNRLKDYVRISQFLSAVDGVQYHLYGMDGTYMLPIFIKHVQKYT